MAGRARRFSSDELDVPDDSAVVGDQAELGGSQKGGHDTFLGDSYGEWGYVAYGDAYAMYDSSRGGNDVFHGGHEMGGGGFFGDYGVSFAGDAAEMDGRAKGGNDSFQGGLNSSNFFAGDALGGMSGQARGGNDVLAGGDGYGTTASNFLLGDAYAFEGDKVLGGADLIQGGNAMAVDGYDAQVLNVAVGDAYAMYGAGVGRNDTIGGGSIYLDDGYGFAMNVLMGDGYLMAGASKGGNDTVAGGDAVLAGWGGEGYAMNIVAGDAYALVEGARAGNDILSGGNAVVEDVGETDGYAFAYNLMAGDSLYADSTQPLGNDEMTGGSGTEGADAYAVNIMYGDVLDLDGYGFFFPIGPESIGAFGEMATGLGFEASAQPQGLRYGNDLLTGGATQAMNFMVGDAAELREGEVGGNDLLRGGGLGTDNTLIGDAGWVQAGARGGSDRLISGAGQDQMWGDANEGMEGMGGADRFVFGRDNGSDSIHDFRASDGDKIDLSAFKPLFSNYSALAASGRLQEQESGVWIDLGRADSEEEHGVMIVGVSLADLGSGSFIL